MHLLNTVRHIRKQWREPDESLTKILQEYIVLLRTQRDMLELTKQYEISIQHDKHNRVVEWVVNKKYLRERYIVA